MDVEYINPFIESVNQVFSTMLETEVSRGDVRVSRTQEFSPIELTALIGMSGEVRGTVALAFSSRVAVACVCKMLDTEIRYVDATVVDGISELVNMIAGSAKAKLVSDDRPPVQLSLPTVVRGRDYVLAHPRNTVWLTVPFTSALGSFILRIALSNSRKSAS